MSRFYDSAKRQYQKHLEKRDAAEKERGKTVFVDDVLLPDAVPLCFGVIGTGHVFDRWMHDMQMLPVSSGVRVKGVVAGRSDCPLLTIARNVGVCMPCSRHTVSMVLSPTPMGIPKRLTICMARLSCVSRSLILFVSR